MAGPISQTFRESLGVRAFSVRNEADWDALSIPMVRLGPYRMDGLTTSRYNLAKILEVFDKHGANLVLVTEVYATKLSHGRNTLTKHDDVRPDRPPYGIRNRVNCSGCSSGSP